MSVVLGAGLAVMTAVLAKLLYTKVWAAEAGGDDVDCGGDVTKCMASDLCSPAVAATLLKDKSMQWGADSGSDAVLSTDRTESPVKGGVVTHDSSPKDTLQRVLPCGPGVQVPIDKNEIRQRRRGLKKSKSNPVAPSDSCKARPDAQRARALRPTQPRKKESLSVRAPPSPLFQRQLKRLQDFHSCFHAQQSATHVCNAKKRGVQVKKVARTLDQVMSEAVVAHEAENRTCTLGLLYEAMRLAVGDDRAQVALFLGEILAEGDTDDLKRSIVPLREAFGVGLPGAADVLMKVHHELEPVLGHPDGMSEEEERAWRKYTAPYKGYVSQEVGSPYRPLLSDSGIGRQAERRYEPPLTRCRLAMQLFCNDTVAPLQ